MQLTYNTFSLIPVHKTKAGLYSFIDPETGRRKRTKNHADYIKAARQFIADHNPSVIANALRNGEHAEALREFLSFHGESIIKGLTESTWLSGIRIALRGCTYWSIRRAYIEIRPNGSAAVYMFTDTAAEAAYKALTSIQGNILHAETPEELDSIIDGAAWALDALKEYTEAAAASFFIPESIFEYFRDDAKRQALEMKWHHITPEASEAAQEIAAYCNALGA